MLRRGVYNFFKSSFYFDFFIKKVSEAVVRNLSIYTAVFFCEKFIIEFLTQVSIDRAIKVLNSFTSSREFFFESFFCQFITLAFYFLAAVELLYLFS